jgi:hypothetical protein
MAPRDSRSVNRCGHAHLACQFPINVTVPPPTGNSMITYAIDGPKRARKRSQAFVDLGGHDADQMQND